MIILPSKPYFSQFADIAQVVYLEHRGNGRTDRSTPKHWNLDQWADDVHQFCHVLEIERPIVLGVSFGGAVAMNYVARYPDEPAKLILISTTGRKRIDRSLAVFERLGGTQAREAARRFNEAPGPETGQEFQRYCYPLYFRTTRPSDTGKRAIVNYELVLWWERGQERYRNLLPDLARVTRPVLVMGGEDDPQTPIEDQEDIVNALPSELVHFERFTNCGHGVWPDHPEKAREVLWDFILRN